MIEIKIFYHILGCGLGLAYIPCISSVSVYFERHKSLAFGMATSGKSTELNRSVSLSFHGSDELGICCYECSYLLLRLRIQWHDTVFYLTGVGAGTLIFPLMLDWLNKSYGWRGAVMITGGICLNQCLCAMAFR